MTLARLQYRVQQFWRMLAAMPADGELDEARTILGPQLMGVFASLPPAEQAHGLRVLHRLQSDGASQRELLQAALLHDAGKSRAPLAIWERVLIVLARPWLDLRPASASDRMDGWRRAITIARQHPEWGAQMAEQAGAAPLTVELIRRHQLRLPAVETPTDRLLAQLQAADDWS